MHLAFFLPDTNVGISISPHPSLIFLLMMGNYLNDLNFYCTVEKILLQSSIPRLLRRESAMHGTLGPDKSSISWILLYLLKGCHNFCHSKRPVPAPEPSVSADLLHEKMSVQIRSFSFCFLGCFAFMGYRYF